MASPTLFPGVDYGSLGNTRRMPLAGDYLKRLMEVVKATDPSLTIAVTSGGQAKKGTAGPRTGGTRHDIEDDGHGHTSDLVLVRNGKKIRPGDDKALYASFLQNAAASGFSGIGHYAWGVHIGGGSQAAWGPSTGSSDLDPVFGAAITKGWAGQFAQGYKPSPTAPATVPLGNPTVGLYDAVRAVPGALINVATGNGDGDDARKVKTIFAFQNLMGITQINNLLVSGLYE